jgi:tetratricopeptide (TPR) repeat protein
MIRPATCQTGDTPVWQKTDTSAGKPIMSKSGPLISVAYKRLALHYLAATRVRPQEEYALYQDWLQIEPIWDWLIENSDNDELLVSCTLAFDFYQDRLGIWPDSIRRNQRGMGAAQAIGNHYCEAIILNNLGVAYGYLGELGLAIESYERALEIY